MRFRLYERGRMVDEYLSVPTYYGELAKGDELALAANPTLVARLTGAEREDVRRVARTAVSPAALPPAPELYEQHREADGARAVRLIDAARCPYCARVRIALAEKGLDYETVEIDLSRPARLGLRAEPAGARPDPRRRVRRCPSPR